MIKSYIKDSKKLYEVFVSERNQQDKQISKRKRGINSEREAKQVEFELKSELKLNCSAAPPIKWSHWKEEILLRVKIKFKKATLQNYESYIKKWVPKKWDGLNLNQISSKEIYEAIELTKTHLSPVSQHTFLKILKRIFQEALEGGIISVNPAKNISLRVPESSKKVLNTSEVDELLRNAKDYRHRFYPIWCLAVKTGMRSGELYALTWGDVDFERNLISINKQWTKKDGLTDTKNHENRLVPISCDLNVFLFELKKNNSSSDHVLPHLTEWTNGEQAAVLRTFCKAINLPQVKFHDLRATFITNMLSQGVPLVKVMSIVGHKKMETTDIYLRLAGVDIKGATNALSYSLPMSIDVENVISVNFQKRSR